MIVTMIMMILSMRGWLRKGIEWAGGSGLPVFERKLLECLCAYAPFPGALQRRWKLSWFDTILALLRCWLLVENTPRPLSKLAVECGCNCNMIAKISSHGIGTEWKEANKYSGSTVLLIKISEAWKQSKYRDPVWCLRRRHPATQNITPTSKSSHLSQIS